MGTSTRVPGRLRVRTRRACAVALLALLAGASACTIERTRGLGDPCLQDRECVEGLRCLPGTDNRTACAAPPSGLPDVVVPRDAAPVEAGGEAGSMGDAQADVLAADARDGSADAAPAADAGADAAVDAPADSRADATTQDSPAVDVVVDVVAVDAASGE